MSAIALMMEADDATLVSECLRGEREAFEALIRRYERPIFNAVLRMVHVYDDAKDLTQLAFVKAFENLGRFDPKYRFYSWIYRIAVNETLKFLKGRHRFEPLDDRWESAGRNPEEHAAGQEVGRNVQESLMAITPDYRAVIVLRHFLGCSYRDMSQILGIPEKTVKSRLFTGRQRLREVLVAKGML